EAAEESADVTVARDLGITPGAGVLRIRRLRLADRSPMAIEEVWLSEELFPGLLDEDLDGSLYEQLESRYGVTVYRHDRRISAISVDEAMRGCWRSPSVPRRCSPPRSASTGAGAASSWAARSIAATGSTSPPSPSRPAGPQRRVRARGR